MYRVVCWPGIHRLPLEPDFLTIPHLWPAYTGNKSLGRCFSFNFTVTWMTNIGPTLCIQPYNINSTHSHSCSAFKHGSRVIPFIKVKVNLCYSKWIPRLLDRNALIRVIVLDKNSLHCWFLLNEKLVVPALVPCYARAGHIFEWNLCMINLCHIFFQRKPRWRRTNWCHAWTK